MTPLPDTWPELVTHVLNEHALSLRGQRARTGLAHSTVKGWVEGIKPSMDGALAFARGFKLDENHCLRAAGYPPVDSGSDDEDEARLQEARERIRKQLADAGVPLPATLTGTYHGGAGSTTVDGIIGDMDNMAEMLLERHLKRTQGQG